MTAQEVVIGDRVKRKPEKHDSLNERGGVGEHFLSEVHFAGFLMSRRVQDSACSEVPLSGVFVADPPAVIQFQSPMAQSL